MTYEEILSAMRARYRELSGFDADAASDIGIRLQVLAVEVASLYKRMSALYAEVFPQTSTGGYLDMHAETRGLARKPGLAAQGVLRFSRETPAYTDIEIPRGILCATKPQPQIRFETAETAILKAGQTSVDAPAHAVDPGALGNVAAGAVCMMISPAVGISAVANPEPFSEGADPENDEALRARLLESYQNISNGTNTAFYYDLAMSDEGVASANILPRKRGRGTVDVVVACRVESAQNEIIAEIQADLDKRKEINVDVLVRAAEQDIQNISVEIAVKDGYNFALVAAEAKSALENCVSALGVGQSLLLATLGNRLLAVDGVYNYRIAAPAKDVLTASDRVLRPGAVAVSGMAVG